MCVCVAHATQGGLLMGTEPNMWVWWSRSGAMRGGGEDRHRDEKEAASSSGLVQE